MIPARNPTKAEALASEHAHLPYRPDIDGLRAIAVLFVVGFHAFPRFFKGGFIGVDIFFVISGFLISSILFRSLENGSFSFVDFYSRRIRRIFPALLVIFISALAFGWFALFPDEYKQLGKHVAGGAGFISNIILWWESGYFDTASELKPLLHLWSLGIEEQFYLVWPLILWLVWKKRFNLLTLTALVAIVSFGLNLTKYKVDLIYDFYSPQTRFWELLAGAMLAHVMLHPPKMKWVATFREKFSKRNESRWYNFLSFFGLVLIAFVAFKLRKEHRFPGIWAVLPVLGAVCLIVSGSGAWVNRKILSNRVLVWFGLISYPLYLWHWPLLSFARIIEAGKPRQNIRIAAVLLSILLAWLTYRLIERPIRFGRSGKKKFIALLLLIVMLVTGFAGYQVYRQDGLKFRGAAQVPTVSLLDNFNYAYRQSCESLTKEKYWDDWCNPGSGAEPVNTALVGDSVANAYSPMLSAYVRKSNPDLSFVQFARGQCPSVLNYGPSYCKTFSDRVFDYIQSSPTIRTVVIGVDWQAYHHHKLFKFSKEENRTESGAAFYTAFEKTVNAYKKMGKKVVIFLSPPSVISPRSCIVRPMLPFSEEGVCNIPLEYARKNEKGYREHLVPLLQRLDVPWFDPFLHFCNDTICNMGEDTSEGKQIFYADSIHLSVFGGRYLAGKGAHDLDKLFMKDLPGVRTKGR